MGRTWKDKQIKEALFYLSPRASYSSPATEEWRVDSRMPFILRQRKDSSIIQSPSRDRLGFGMLQGEQEGTSTRTGH